MKTSPPTGTMVLDGRGAWGVVTRTEETKYCVLCTVIYADNRTKYWPVAALTAEGEAK